MRYYYGSRRRRVSIHFLLVAVSVFTGFGVLLLTLRSVDPPSNDGFFLSDDRVAAGGLDSISASKNGTISAEMYVSREKSGGSKSCATVEEMGESFKGTVWKESLRVRRIIQEHFSVNGASRIRSLPPEQFCKHGFVLGKASEAGFGNEMYKILNAAALSIMLNRSLIIGQTRHIGSFSSLPVLR